MFVLPRHVMQRTGGGTYHVDPLGNHDVLGIHRPSEPLPRFGAISTVFLVWGPENLSLYQFPAKISTPPKTAPELVNWLRAEKSGLIPVQGRFPRGSKFGLETGIRISFRVPIVPNLVKFGRLHHSISGRIL